MAEKPRQSIMGQKKPSKNATEFFSVGCLLLGVGLAVSVVCVPSETICHSFKKVCWNSVIAS